MAVDEKKSADMRGTSSLVVKIFKQLLSELRKGLSEAEVWDLFGITRPSAPDDLHGRILHSVPMIVGPVVVIICNIVIGLPVSL